MAKCANEIIKQNGFSDKILLIPKRSTEISVGKGKGVTIMTVILSETFTLI